MNRQWVLLPQEFCDEAEALATLEAAGLLTEDVEFEYSTEPDRHVS